MFAPVTRVRYNFWLDEELKEGLRQIKERDGILESEQIRRAIQKWLEDKGVTKSQGKRAPTRKPR